MDRSGSPDAAKPGPSGVSRKRKQPDEDDIPLTESPLCAPPIDNEYDQSNDEDGEDDEDDEDQSHDDAELDEIKLAQEKATIHRYGDIIVTPFNLDEELEEGRFDKSGYFIFDKSEDERDEDSDDAWAESIDWDEVRRKEKESEKKASKCNKQTP